MILKKIEKNIQFNLFLYCNICSFSNEDSALNSITESKAALYSYAGTQSTNQQADILKSASTSSANAVKGIKNESLIEENESQNTKIKQKNQSTATTDKTLKRTQQKLFTNQLESNLKNTTGTAATAPAIDFKLDVKIEISSGKCILHAAKPPAPPPPPPPIPMPMSQQQYPQGTQFTPTQTPATRSQQQQQQQPIPTSQPNQKGFFNPTYEYHNTTPNYTRLTVINEQTQQQQQQQQQLYYQQQLYQQQVQQQQLFYQQQLQNYQQTYQNKITNFIFPAIRMKAYYESTYVEVNNRLFKKANIYSTIKIDSFVLPSAYMLQRDYFRSNKDMCISPALLDFLEQTLEPFNNQSTHLKTNMKTSSTATTSTGKKKKSKDHHHHSKLKSQSYYTNSSENDEDDYVFEQNDQYDEEDENDFDDDDDYYYDEHDDLFDVDHDYNRTHKARNHLDERYHQHFQRDLNANTDANANNFASGHENNMIVKSANSSNSANNNNNQTQVYFPVDVIVIVSMLPSSIRFTCAPQSPMECLLKLPTIELVFSTKSLTSNQLKQYSETISEEGKCTKKAELTLP